MSSISLLILFSFLQGATVSSTADAVHKVENRFTSALLKRDHNEFEELLADDLIHIGFEGQVAGKGEYMAFFKQGSWQYRKYQPTNVTVKVHHEANMRRGLCSGMCGLRSKLAINRSQE